MKVTAPLQYINYHIVKRSLTQNSLYVNLLVYKIEPTLYLCYPVAKTPVTSFLKNCTIYTEIKTEFQEPASDQCAVRQTTRVLVGKKNY